MCLLDSGRKLRVSVYMFMYVYVPCVCRVKRVRVTCNVCVGVRVCVGVLHRDRCYIALLSTICCVILSGRARVRAYTRRASSRAPLAF